MDIYQVLKGQRKFKGCTKEQIMLKTNLSERAVDRRLSQLAKEGKLQKTEIKRLVYILK
jgi:predicted transcriptional regulator